MGKTVVFGIFKRNCRVSAKVVPDCRRAILQAVIRGRVYPGASYSKMDDTAATGLSTLGTRSITVLTTAKMNLPGARLTSPESRVPGVEAVVLPIQRVQGW